MAELYLLKPIFPGNNNKDMLLKISKVIGAPSINSWPEGLKASKKIDFKFPNSGQFGKENLNKEFSIRNMIKNASPEAICFMEDLLQWDPNKRPTASELLCHPFLKDFEFRINQNENILSGVRKKEIDERADNKERNETLSRSKIGSKKSNDDIGTPFILKSNK